MKYTVEAIENAKTKEDWQKIKMNRTLVQAYLWSTEAGNDLPNFAEVIWDEDIEAILQDCKENGIKEFTISSTFSSLITTIDKLTELGCSLDGIIKINDRYTHFGREERDLIPAFKMTVKEA
ncbi:MAG: hypothetical protein LKM40_01125 [Mageeibacillus sp.]|nr:hypothetical protein [Mageeibacillus sp.]